MKRISFYFLVILLLAGSIKADDADCYKEAADIIETGKKIKLVTDSGKVNGTLNNIDLLNNEITIDQTMNNNINQTVVSFDKVAAIQYRERGHFKPKYAILGTVGGAVFMGTVGYLASGNVDSG